MCWKLVKGASGMEDIQTYTSSASASNMIEDDDEYIVYVQDDVCAS